MARQKSEFLSALGILFEIFRLFVNDILAAGGSDDDIRRIGTDAVLRKKLVEVVVKVKEVLPVWKTIIVGIHKSADEYRKVFENDFRISDRANDVLERIQFTESEASINLVKLSVRELGLDRDATLWEILFKAQELGLAPCPPEVGPALREQYADQPHGEVLWIGMEPVYDSEGRPEVFRVLREGDCCWLYTFSGPGWLGSPSRQFVFVRK